MAIDLKKGQKIDLSKNGSNGAGLRRVMVGLGWDEAPRGFSLFTRPQPIDCDASVILCGADGKIVSADLKECCVYYGNLRHHSGAIVHQGDNLTGAGDGDDEQILVDLSAVPANIEKMVFVVNIYDARVRNQHFGMIRNAFIRLVDMDGKAEGAHSKPEICRFNLSENYANMTGLVVGEIYKKNGVWKFNAIGQPVQEASRLDALIRLYI